MYFQARGLSHEWYNSWLSLVNKVVPKHRFRCLWNGKGGKFIYRWCGCGFLLVTCVVIFISMSVLLWQVYKDCVFLCYFLWDSDDLFEAVRYILYNSFKWPNSSEIHLCLLFRYCYLVLFWLSDKHKFKMGTDLSAPTRIAMTLLESIET